MAPQFPTIKDFFPSQPSPGQKTKSDPNTTVENGDGFTTEEMEAQLNLSPYEWTPQHEYDDVMISELSPGPRRVTFMARVVNFYNQLTPSKMPKAAKGCLKILVKDDSAALKV